jgi:uncharacterized membrane protein
MDEQQIPRVPPSASEGSAAWAPTASDYPPPNGYAQAPPVGAAPAAGEGLSDTAAGALAYVTIIPAIIFLVMAPYNTKPFVKFHAFQCLGLAVVWFCLGIIGVIPILGWAVLALGSLALLVCWILCIVKASQGGALKLPVISDFASKQSGYRP